MVEAAEQLTLMSIKLLLKIQGINIKCRESIICCLDDRVGTELLKIAETQPRIPNNGNLDFDSTFKIPYFLEKNQSLQIEFQEADIPDNIIGKCTVLMKTLVNAPNYRFEAVLESETGAQQSKVVITTIV